MEPTRKTALFVFIHEFRDGSAKPEVFKYAGLPRAGPLRRAAPVNNSEIYRRRGIPLAKTTMCFTKGPQITGNIKQRTTDCRRRGGPRGRPLANPAGTHKGCPYDRRAGHGAKNSPARSSGWAQFVSFNFPNNLIRRAASSAYGTIAQVYCAIHAGSGLNLIRPALPAFL
jgi:hypothetical protein